jgi:hypothetical protein
VRAERGGFELAHGGVSKNFLTALAMDGTSALTTPTSPEASQPRTRPAPPAKTSDQGCGGVLAAKRTMRPDNAIAFPAARVAPRPSVELTGCECRRQIARGMAG